MLDSPVLREALDYWESLPATNGLPGRSAINPMKIPRLLPTTILVDVEESGDFRYRLAGTMVEDRYRVGAIKGLTPRDLMGDAAENVLRPYRRVRDEGVMFYREATLDWVSPLAALCPLQGAVDAPWRRRRARRYDYGSP